MLADDTFVDLPLIQLLDRPVGMPDIVPHVSPEGCICYAAKGTLTLNIFEPAGQLLACLDRAIEVVERAIKGEMAADLAEEFFAYWQGSPVFADIPLSKAGSAKAFLWRPASNGEPTLFLTDNAERTRTKLSENVFSANARAVDVQVFSSNCSPGVRQENWPPKTVGEFLSWQGELDSDCARRVVQSLEKMMRAGRSYALSLIKSPTSWYGIFIDFDHTRRTGSLAQRLNYRPALLGCSIWPLSIIRIDDDYLASRNVPGKKTLVGLRIALVGCGTIGGYLADLLVRAGAGLKDGVLTLIDPENFYPGNLGRHRLGMSAISKSKANALADELQRVIPSARVEPCPEDVRRVTNLRDFDLVIDATGEEALSQHLNNVLRQECFVPMVFCWIAGAGNSVHALIRDTPDAACYKCLSDRETRDGQVAGNPELAGFGCESLYVPFSASVSVSAAALALDAVLDWVNGEIPPKYRVRTLKGPHFIQEADPEKSQCCPSCGS